MKKMIHAGRDWVARLGVGALLITSTLSTLAQ